jgi:hypothetical protein
MNPFVQAEPLRRAAFLLLNGWGHDIYSRTTQLRADDLLVRARACAFLNAARGVVDQAEANYRREHMPTPTRARPFPEPEAVTTAQRLERLSREIGALEGQIRHQPAPEGDRLSALHRSETETLLQLRDCDALLIGQCDLLQTIVAGRSGTDLAADEEPLRQGLQAIGETLRRRAAVLS